MKRQLCHTFTVSLLVLSCLLLPAAAFGQQGTSDDTLRILEELQNDQKQLLQEMETLRDDLKRLRRTEKSDEPPALQTVQIEKLETRIDELEVRIDGLSSRIAVLGGTPLPETEQWTDWEDDDWDDEWDEWEEKWDEEWSLSGNRNGDDQYDMKKNLLRFYPASFPFLYPLTTRYHETILRYNRVEGIYIGVAQSKGLHWHSQPRIVSTGSLGYGTANHRWRYSLGLYAAFYPENQIIEVGAEGHSFTDSQDQWLIDKNENSVTALFAREDYMDYFSREGFSASTAWYYRDKSDLQFRATLAYMHDSYANMNRRTNWSVFGGDKRFRDNPAINDGNMNSIAVGAVFSTMPSIDEFNIGWNVSALYETGGGFLTGDFEFSQITLDVVRYQPLGKWFNLNLRLRGGASDGLLPMQRSLYLGGISTMPGYSYKEFSGAHAALANVELIVKSPISEHSRGWFRGLTRVTNLIITYDVGSTNSVSPLSNHDVTNGAMPASFSDSFDLDNWKSDFGLALGSSDGTVRIGAAWRLDRSDKARFILRFTRPF